MVFQLTRTYVEEQIADSKIALQKHLEGVRVHEVVIEAFEKELAALPEEEKEELKRFASAYAQAKIRNEIT